jgi:hypothetical protein
MDFSKLTQNEKLAVYGSAAVFLAGIISNWGGLFWLAVLAALATAAIVLLPQAASAIAPIGSKGTVLATLGFVAAGVGIIELLRYVEFFLDTLGRFNTIAFIVALVGAGLMAYAGWQELQKEGGKWRFGATSPTASNEAAPVASEQASSAPAEPTIDESPEIEERRTEA